jgi:fructosamine-3-kinase
MQVGGRRLAVAAGEVARHHTLRRALRAPVVTPNLSIIRSLEDALRGRWTVLSLDASGFCSTWRARGAAQELFLKSVPLEKAEVLEAEADGLSAITATAAIRAPAVITCWRDVERGLTVLALEWLELRTPDRGFGERLGASVANLHRARALEPRAGPWDWPGSAPTAETGGGRFGWRRDNMLGGTPQVNPWTEGGTLADWLAFFGGARLGAMRDRLASRGAPAAITRCVDAVVDALPSFFTDGHLPRASLIHGDLWSGNWGMLADGTPVIYDPAVSCSDPEAELAMMELFGSPPPGFWGTYRESAGVHEGYTRRKGLYQLYHLLNHALLFGGSYLPQCLDLAGKLARPTA